MDQGDGIYVGAVPQPRGAKVCDGLVQMIKSEITSSRAALDLADGGVRRHVSREVCRVRTRVGVDRGMGILAATVSPL
jgi:hypothetical protein